MLRLGALIVGDWVRVRGSYGLGLVLVLVLGVPMGWVSGFGFHF